MPYAPVAGGFHAHVKVQRLGKDLDALSLWVLALSWVTTQETDGEVPLLVTRTLAGRRAGRWATALVRVGLWERTRRGYRFHDFLDWQKSRHELNELRRVRRQAGSYGGRRSAEAKAQAKEQAKAEASAASKVQPTTPRYASLRYDTPRLAGEAPVDNSPGAATPATNPEEVAPATGSGSDSDTGCDQPGCTLTVAQHKEDLAMQLARMRARQILAAEPQ